MQREKHKNNGKKTQNIQELWDNINRWNICIIGISEEKVNGREEIFEEATVRIFQNWLQIPNSSSRKIREH